MIRFQQLIVSGLGIALAGCLAACGTSQPTPAPTSTEPATGTTAPAAVDDGITLKTTSPTRIAGVYVDRAGDTIQFDFAKVNDDIFADITGNAGRPILHIETTGEDYNFTYMGGGLTLHTTKTFVAAQRAAAQTEPANVSTSGFAFAGDTHVLDDMLKLPEVAQFPILSRALGVRGFTGSDYPATLVLHKMAQQSAQALAVHVPTLETPITKAGYCDAYPNQNNDCFGMCGPGCDCWSWVCGDCCYHYGCAVHDQWCRDGEWWYCYNITAVIALFGC